MTLIPVSDEEIAEMLEGYPSLEELDKARPDMEYNSKAYHPYVKIAEEKCSRFQEKKAEIKRCFVRKCGEEAADILAANTAAFNLLYSYVGCTLSINEILL